MENTSWRQPRPSSRSTHR